MDCLPKGEGLSVVLCSVSDDRLLQGHRGIIILSGEEAGDGASVPEDHKGKFRGGKTDGALFRRRRRCIMLQIKSTKLAEI